MEHPDRQTAEHRRPHPGDPPGRLQERLRFRFLREAPFLANAGDLGVATSPVEPWPHQLRTVREVTRRFPESFLFCDEVGLGKTIEAGLALRQLVISGRVRRALLLVPKGLLRQWQEELHEKTALDVPRFTAGKLLDVFDREVAEVGASGNPWNSTPLLLASSQLAKRRDRRAQLLAADPWDLLLVDEAHHARRRGSRRGTDGRFSGRPNRLLELLRALADRARCLYLLTATPMQVHPVEVWDLLKLLGLGGLWGSREDRFLGFFEQLRKPFAGRDWDFLLAMLADYLEQGGELDPGFKDAAVRRLGSERWQSIDALIKNPEGAAGDLDHDTRAVLDGLLRRHTPLRGFSWRATRDQLRAYRRQGLLEAGVPDREPRNVWITLKDDERRLYERIERYLSELYQRYEACRHGLGFVMTVYRRRLTSSFYAVRRSLERRREFLGGGATAGEDLFAEQQAPELETPELEAPEQQTPELETPELEARDSAAAGAALSGLYRSHEAACLDEFLRDLDTLGSDSKLEQLLSDLDEIFSERDTVLVFTQYTDTMDYLRDELRRRYAGHASAGHASAGRVACYSGRGGERWHGSAWASCGKESLKEAFRRRQVSILLCTEAACEGLNLQTCGVLINYDMPWNPMRVEQRIGRIDRIGQVFPEVWVRNYFYRDTVEATIYQRLGDRIRWFEEVVGTLEPILHKVGESIRHVAMLPSHRRDRHLELEIGTLRREIDGRSPEVVDLMSDLEPAEGTVHSSAAHSSAAAVHLPAAPIETPVDRRQVEHTLLGSEILKGRFTPDPEIEGAYRLDWNVGEHRRAGSPPAARVGSPEGGQMVTFSPEVFDRKPYTLELLTWGNPLFEELLRSHDGPGTVDEPCGVGLYRTREPAPVSLFFSSDAVPIERYADLDAELSPPAPFRGWRESVEGSASVAFSRARQRVLQAMHSIETRRRRSQRRALAQAARQVLVRSALVELARARSPGLFEEPQVHGFGSEIVRALGHRGAPFDRLLDIAGVPAGRPRHNPQALEARADDPFYATVEGRSNRVLERRLHVLLDEAEQILAQHTALEEKIAGVRLAARQPSATGIVERQWFPLTPLDEGRPLEGTSGELPLEGTSGELPFRILNPEEVRPFRNAVPVYDSLGIAAGLFADGPAAAELLQAGELFDPGDYRWAELDGSIRAAPAPGLFVTRVRGESMNRRVPGGSWCLFRLGSSGAPEGKIVLAGHHQIRDPELDGQLTLRVFHSETEHLADGSWQTRQVVLEPSSTDPGFEPIVLGDLEDGELRLIAELVAVLGRAR